jgi:hypothetical protein
MGGSFKIKPTNLVGIILLYYSSFSVGLSKPKVDRMLSTNVAMKTKHYVNKSVMHQH